MPAVGSLSCDVHQLQGILSIANSIPATGSLPQADTGIKRPRQCIEPFTFDPAEPPLRKLRSAQVQSTPVQETPAQKAASDALDRCTHQQQQHSGTSVAGAQPCSITDDDAEYLQQLHASEARTLPSSTYLSSVQRHIDAAQRQVLVDWLVEVADEFQLSQTTLFLAVSLLDRFLSRSCIPCTALQLLGITCVWVAAKYEDVYPPSAEELVDMTDGTYSVAEVLQMERKVLAGLRWELSAPTTRLFLEAYSEQRQQACGRAIMLAEYLLELALLEYGCLAFRPSQLAAAALYLAELTEQQSRCAGSSSSSSSKKGAAARPVLPLQQVLPALAALHQAHAWACRKSTASAVKDKYSAGALLRVAALPLLQHLPSWQ